MKSRTTDEAQIAHFSKQSSQWWDYDGPFAPLHRMTPCRIGFLRDQMIQNFGGSDSSFRPLSGLSVLDVGCGGGLVCEPLARLGATVTGLDADSGAIETARTHAKGQGLPITYIAGAVEDLAHGRGNYDVLLALEIIEHVEGPGDFLRMCSSLLRPGGILILSSLNRTWKSYLLGIVVAENVLRWVPPGTHDWDRFPKPSELGRMARECGLEVTEVMGMVYNPLRREFSLSRTALDVNYFLVTRKP